MKKLTKGSIQNYALCPRLANLGNIFPPPNFFSEQGEEVDRKAAEFFGAEMGEHDIFADTSVSQFPPDKRFAQLKFRADNATVRPDIVWFDADGDFHFIEVKSSGHSEKNVEKHRQDVAAQVAVLNHIRPNLRVASASLALLNPAARGVESPELFIITDLTDFAVSTAATLDIPNILRDISSEPPQQSFCAHCKSCEHRRDCFPEFPEKHSILDIPNIKFGKLQSLYFDDTLRAELVPDHMLTDRQRTFVRAWEGDKPRIDMRAVEHFLEMTNAQQHGGVHFLDFESVRPALPLYDNHTPYTQVPFQFSLVTTHADGRTTRHDFLHDAADDPSPHFINALTEKLCADDFPIVVYSWFESSLIKEMILRSEKEDQLLVIVNRLCDLEKCVKTGYIHPDANGKSSIKVILPLVVPDMTYDGMNVAHGDDALRTWFRLRKSADVQERQNLRKDLIDYCHQDAVAMLRILEGIRRDYQKESDA